MGIRRYSAGLVLSSTHLASFQAIVKPAVRGNHSLRPQLFHMMAVRIALASAAAGGARSLYLDLFPPRLPMCLRRPLCVLCYTGAKPRAHLHIVQWTDDG